MSWRAPVTYLQRVTHLERGSKTLRTTWMGLLGSIAVVASAACGGPLASDELEPSTRLLKFGEVPVGEQRETIVTLRNLSDRPLENLTLQLLATVDSPLFFTFTPFESSPLVIPPNGTVELPIQYQPREPGEHGAGIFIVTPSPQDPGVVIHLRGTSGVGGTDSDGGTPTQTDGGNAGG